jgi:hypothetical protein
MVNIKELSVSAAVSEDVLLSDDDDIAMEDVVASDDIDSNNHTSDLGERLNPGGSINGLCLPWLLCLS